MTDFRAELLAAFAAEHREHLAALRDALAREEEDGAVALEPAALREAFRRVHSLKGAARAVDLPGPEAVAHRLEALLAREGEAAGGGPARLAAAAVALLRRGLDAVEAAAAAAEAGEPAPPLDAVLAALDGAEAPLAPSPAVEPFPGPPPDPPPGPPVPGPAPAAEAHLRVEPERMERLSAAVHAIGALADRGDALAGLRGVEAELRALRRHLEGLRAAIPADPALAARLRGLDAALGGVTRRVAGLVLRGRDGAAAMERAALALREELEALLLVPAATVLGPLAAVAREMAHGAGRDVAVRVEGLETRAERRVLQALKDPVLHLLRNALSHGAASGGEGRRAEIGLRVRGDEGGLTVTVWDDGPGPDLAAIEAAAVRRGLLPARAPGAPPPAAARLLGLALEPGLSTAPEVGRLAGRGMGLSVVAEAAAGLGGAAALRPRQGGGAEVEIALPPSTGRRALLLVEAAGRLLALATGGPVAVGPLLRLDPAALLAPEGRPVARLVLDGGEALVPVLPLAALLGPGEEGEERARPPGGAVPAVLLSRGRSRLALSVTALRDARSLLVAEVDAPGVDAALVAGAALTEGDRVAIVLRPEALLERGLRRHAGAPPRPAPPPAARRRHVLVVDDSITTRTLERSILEAGGYRVTLAVDGVDALDLLRASLSGEEASVDLVLADVEMPRMDGFGLLEAIRTDPALAGLPLILMTSREAPGDVRRGMELGANAYLTKQGFDQQALLDAVGQLV